MADDDALLNQAVVLDCGSGLIKAGLAGETEAKAVIPAIIGRKKYDKIFPEGIDRHGAWTVHRDTKGRQQQHTEEIFIGPHAQDFRGALRLTHVSDAESTNWDDLGETLAYLYSTHLRVVPDEHPVLFTMPAFASAKARTQAAQMLFERLKVPAVCFQPQPVLSLYASRKVTGVVLESGDTRTQCVPIFEGYAIEDAMNAVDLGGRDVTTLLQLLLRKGGHALHTSAERELVREIKEKLCYVSLNPARDEDACARAVAAGQRDFSASYTLPDENVVTIAAERFRAPEILFRPSTIGLEYPGVPELVAGCVSACHMDMRAVLLNDVVISGGTTKLPGYGQRLAQGLNKLVPKDTKVRVLSSPERHKAVWVGGSIFASLATFKSLLYTRRQYEEDKRPMRAVYV